MSHDPVTVAEAAQIEVLLFVALSFLGGLGIVYWGFQTYRFGTTIRDTPTEKVRSVAMGRTEVVGEVVPVERVFDQPFTDGQCVFGELEVEEYREYKNDDDKDPQWVTVQTDTFSTPFAIDDGTGRILVEPNEDTIYEISDEHTTKIEVNGGRAPPEPVQEFLNRGSNSGGSVAQAADEAAGRIARVLGKITFGRVGVTGGAAMTAAGGSDTLDGEAPDPGGDWSVANDVVADESETGEQAELSDTVGSTESRDPSDGDRSSVEHVSRARIGSVSGTSRDRRYVQRVLPAHEEAYVYGGATQRPPEKVTHWDDREMIATDPSTGEFIVSDRGEFNLAGEYRKRSIVYIGAGIVASTIVLALLAQILITGPVYGIDMAMP